MSMIPAPFNQLPNDAVKPFELKKDHILFRQGESVDSLFYLELGGVTLSRYGLDGNEVIIHVAQQNETFAEAALFSDCYHCTAVSTKHTKLWAINKSATLRFSEDNPTFAMDLTARFAKQIQQLRSQKELFSIRSATDRVYVALNQGLLDANIKQFASSIGLTHEVTYRALAILVKENKIVKTARGSYQLLEEG